MMIGIKDERQAWIEFCDKKDISPFEIEEVITKTKIIENENKLVNLKMQRIFDAYQMLSFLWQHWSDENFTQDDMLMFLRIIKQTLSQSLNDYKLIDGQ